MSRANGHPVLLPIKREGYEPGRRVLKRMWGFDYRCLHRKRSDAAHCRWCRR